MLPLALFLPPPIRGGLQLLNASLCSAANYLLFYNAIKPFSVCAYWAFIYLFFPEDLCSHVWLMETEPEDQGCQT